ncbi:unnamed protein product [Linum trigynum]|uniref:Reverse transcriptase zinc-binding domain-containing protein n=1 Tax=Linum trigynum TaxID=586398 RepID=A0AAV2FB36_9ROSI
MVSFQQVQLIRLSHQWTRQNQQVFWQKILHLNVPERVRVFVWLAVKGKLSTNSVRKFRHLTYDDKCPECKEVPETNFHCLRDCVVAKAVWSKIIPSNRQQQFFGVEVDEWFQKNLMDNSQGGWPGDWASYFCLLTWYIWKCRNDTVFKGIRMSPSTLHNYVTSKASEWIKAWESGKVGNRSINKLPRSEILISWSALPGGYVKLNSDGAAQITSGVANARGVLRNSYGD